jgi:hypothetical protein
VLISELQPTLVHVHQVG